jgi:hypothetical protein
VRGFLKSRPVRWATSSQIHHGALNPQGRGAVKTIGQHPYNPEYQEFGGNEDGADQEGLLDRFRRLEAMGRPEGCAAHRVIESVTGMRRKSWKHGRVRDKQAPWNSSTGLVCTAF